MNQGFRLRYDEFRENDADRESGQTKDVDRSRGYTSASYARSVCFVWLDGRKTHLNYAYFMGADFDVSQAKNWIKLEFSSASVMLGGYNLENLFLQFMEHVPRMVEVVDERYVILENADASFVTDISIERK